VQEEIKTRPPCLGSSDGAVLFVAERPSRRLGQQQPVSRADPTAPQNDHAVLPRASAYPRPYEKPELSTVK